MKKFTLQLAMLAILLGVFGPEAKAQCFFDEDGTLRNLDGTPCNNAVLTAVPFLGIVADARSGAMGDV